VQVSARASLSSGEAWPLLHVSLELQNEQVAPVDVIPRARHVQRELFVLVDRAKLKIGLGHVVVCRSFRRLLGWSGEPDVVLNYFASLTGGSFRCAMWSARDSKLSEEGSELVPAPNRIASWALVELLPESAKQVRANEVRR
jgi:hypothetical protein